jgi:hypothetical protein
MKGEGFRSGDIDLTVTLRIHEGSLFECGVFEVLIKADHGESERVLLCGN